MESVFPPPPLPVAPAPKPAALTVFGILNIIFGAIGLISVLFSYKLYFTPLESQVGPMPEALRASPFCFTCMRALIIPGTLFVLLQLISGIGLLRSSNLARKTALGCALYSIAAGLFSGWLTIRYILPVTLQQALQQMKNADPAVAEMTRTIGTAAGYFGVVVALILPVLTLIFLSRAKVRQYCLARS